MPKRPELRIPKKIVKKKRKTLRVRGVPTGRTFYVLLDKFMKGDSIKVIAEDYGTTEARLRNAILRHLKDFQAVMEVEALTGWQEAESKSFKHEQAASAFFKAVKEDTSTAFKEMLSAPDAEVLTTPEVLFCTLIAEGTAQPEALAQSGLTEGIATNGKKYSQVQGVYKKRCMWLTEKPNIKSYIKHIQAEHIESLEVTKDTLQQKLLQQITRLEESGDLKVAPTIAKLTEQLGKSIGAFTDNIQVADADFDTAFSKALEKKRLSKAPPKLVAV